MDPLCARNTANDETFGSFLSSKGNNDAFEKLICSKENAWETLVPDASEGQTITNCGINEKCHGGNVESIDTLHTSQVSNGDEIQDRIPVSQTSTASQTDDIENVSRMPQAYNECFGGIKEDMSSGKNVEESLTPKKSVNGNDEHTCAENIQHENATPMETKTEASVATLVNCYLDLDELQKVHIEFERVVSDLRNLDEYCKSVLDSSQFYLKNIMGRLVNRKQATQLLVDVKDKLTEVNIRLEEQKEHISAKKKDIVLTKVEDTCAMMPTFDKAKTEIPLINSNDIDLLLIGSSGNGKSATGNAILRTHFFQTAAGTSSNCSISAKSSSKFKDLTINVVDARGVDTNSKSKLEVLESSLSSIKESLQLCDYSFTALLIVIKFGARFTQHESDTIKMIRGILGNGVIQKYGVCVVTHGDNFEDEMEEEKVNETVRTFEDWCREQVGEIGDIFRECSFRCVLFNNKTKDETKREDQIEKLLSLIRHNEKYSRCQFLKAEEGLSKLTQELFLPEVLLKTNKIANDIRSKMVTMKFSFGSNDVFEKANEMLRDLNHYKEYILAAGWDDSAQSKILTVIEPLELEIHSKLRLYNASDCDRRQAHPTKPFLKASSFDENYFSTKHDLFMRTTDVDSMKEKVYSPSEIKELEKTINIKLDNLKDLSRTLTGATASEENQFNLKIKRLKEEYSEFLKSSDGCGMLQEITLFQCGRQQPKTATHLNETLKWDEVEGALNKLKYIIFYLWN